MNLGWQEVIQEKNFYYHRISILIILLFSTLITMLTVIIPFISPFFPQEYDEWVSLIILLLVLSIIIIHWNYHRNVLPKGGDKHSIVVAIVTENIGQKNRISKDFADKLKSQIRKYGLQNSYDIIVTHTAHSEKITAIVQDAFYKDNPNPDFTRFNTICRRMNAKLIIFGSLITRDSPNNKYLLNIDALVRHIPLPALLSSEMQKEFNEVWEKEISFLEKNETTGFKSTSDQVFFAATYMLSFALLIDFNFEKSITICMALKKYITDCSKYEKFETKVNKLLASNYLLNSKFLYVQGEFERATDFNRKYLDLVPNKYGECLSEAIDQVTTKDNPEMALNFIRRASKIANGNGAWRYSEFYLLIRLNKHRKALNIFDDIIKFNYAGELETITEVISFNVNRHKSDLDHIESIFIIGVLAYKKLSNIPTAHDKLEEFVTLTKDDQYWTLLNDRAKYYLRQIKNEMELT